VEVISSLASAEPEASQPLLSVSGLGVSFGPVRALDGVDLSVLPGELVALAGENGAGKTTLVRCIAGDIAPGSGEILLAGKRVAADPVGVARQGIAVVWQDLALCDNLDVAANILLGRESRRLMLSESRFHATTVALLESLNIPVRDTTRSVRTLSGGQRQLVAVARAMGRKPRLLALDEPTAALGVKESEQVEKLIIDLRAQGTTILLACHDIDQMFRLADRIVVLRQGRVVGSVDPRNAHPDDVLALLSGQQVDSSARQQLTRLHGLADRLVSADPSSSLSLILSALGAALGSERLCIHLTAEQSVADERSMADGRSMLGGQSIAADESSAVDQSPAEQSPVVDQDLFCAASLGLAPGLLAPWAKLAFGPAGGPVGLAAASEKPVIANDVRVSPAWRNFGDLAKAIGAASSWSVPVLSPSGLSGVITVLRRDARAPRRDELDLVNLYAGYAASAVERDRLLDQVTARNRVLETIREMLETLAGPVPVGEGLVIAVQALRRGLPADEVALVCRSAECPSQGGLPPGEDLRWRAYAGSLGTDPAGATPSLHGLAAGALAGAHPDGVARWLSASGESSSSSSPTSTSRRALAVSFRAPGGRTVLLARWNGLQATTEETALMEDAAHSLRLALEREEAGFAHQEAAALRRSRELQRDLLSRLSHELRTPLTAIRGYASSLMQPDVTWDADSQHRFLDRIAAESARLGRLVDDLLDFSAIESGIMRMQRDWCDIRLVLEAAVACLPRAGAASVSVVCDPRLPVVWADHDRLEQIFVNLLDNAIRHNPPGTRVRVNAGTEVPYALRGQADGAGNDVVYSGAADAGPGAAVISVIDDGTGMPAERATAPFEPIRRRVARDAGAGLGLSIAKGIVHAHGGSIEMRQVSKGTCFLVRIPVEADDGIGRDPDLKSGDGGEGAALAGTDLVRADIGAVAALGSGRNA
jgi:signal transduction histidine kinase/ABC-type multidrug transport system ATPase subunit